MEHFHANRPPRHQVAGWAIASISRLLAPKPARMRQLIIDLRHRMNWSRPVLAALVGTSVNTLRRWEEGKRTPSMAARRTLWVIHCLTMEEKWKQAMNLKQWVHWEW